MKKLLLSLAVALMAATATAGTVYQPLPERAGFVTPDQATGARIYEYWNTDTNGELVICPTYDQFHYKNGGTCEGTKENNGWKLVRDMVPRGRTYAGFQLSYRGLQIYWK